VEPTGDNSAFGASGKLEGYAQPPLKVVVGVDPSQPNDAVLEMLKALAPGRLHIHLVHAFDPTSSADGDFSLRRSQWTLSQARNALEIGGYGAAWIQPSDDPVDTLIHFAAVERADLIAIGTPRMGRGKVAKGLIERSPYNLLVSKSPPKNAKGLSAVLATDQSIYMIGCIARLAKVWPHGIQQLTVLTANESRTAWLSQGANKSVRQTTQDLLESNRRICEALAPLGVTCRAEVREGYRNAVLYEVMSENQADLLIMGGPNREDPAPLALQSISAELAIHSPYSVLILRP